MYMLYEIYFKKKTIKTDGLTPIAENPQSN